MAHDFFNYLDEMEEIALIEEADSTIKYANKAFLSCFGLKLEEAVGKKLLDFIVPEDRGLCNMEHLVTVDSPSYKVYGRAKRADGKIIWIQYVGKGIFDEKGTLVEFQEIGMDITEFKESINEKVKVLEKANQRIGELTNPIREKSNVKNKFQIVNRLAAYNFTDIIRKSSKMEDVIMQAKAASERDAPVLIHGESGTGKELFAQSIHNYGKRANGPFVAVNCGAIPGELIDSELFGYTEGAFTGAVRQGKQGKFEQASWGTLFLDEIGEMPLPQQASLLRVLETKTITRIGGDEEIAVDVRIICATNKDLKQEIAQGRFREDLYFRLNVMDINIPPLRERKEDLLELIGVFINEMAGRNFDKSKFYDEQIIKLFEYDWPGNVRELKSVLERIIFLPGYNVDELCDTKNTNLEDKSKVSTTKKISEKDKSEKQSILEYLEKFNGNVSETARSMGVSRKTLYQKFKKYNIR